MITYTFANAERTEVHRLEDGDESPVVIPWNPDANEPLDIGGHIGRIWKADNNPRPTPYVPPPALRF